MGHLICKEVSSITPLSQEQFTKAQKQAQLYHSLQQQKELQEQKRQIQLMIQRAQEYFHIHWQRWIHQSYQESCHEITERFSTVYASGKYMSHFVAELNRLGNGWLTFQHQVDDWLNGQVTYVLYISVVGHK